MLYVSFAEAWRLYCAARPLMPSLPPHHSAAGRSLQGSVRVESVLEIASAFDVILLDAYGVLHVGNGPLPGVAATLAALCRLGKPLAVLTNDVTHAPDAVRDRLCALGLPLESAQIVSGRAVLGAALAALPPGEGMVSVLASHPEPIVAHHPGTRAGTYDPADLDRARAFVLVDTNAWDDDTPARQLTRSLARHPRPLIVCNPDVTCPFRGRLSLEPGSVAFPLAQEGPASSVVFLGKPFPGIYDLVRGLWPDVAPARFLAVGDSPHTDILGAAAAGMTSLLVESGLLAGRDSLALCAEAGIHPDYVTARL